MKDRKEQEPAMGNLPDGVIDWEEISAFIEDMLAPDIQCRKGWKIIDDSSMTGNLQDNSLLVLHTLYDDLYGCFYKQHDERLEVWRRMEQFIQTKYSNLSDKALSRVISRYYTDDR